MRLDYNDRDSGARLDIGYGEAAIIRGRWGEFYLQHPDLNARAELSLPDEDDPEALAEGVEITLSSGRYSGTSSLNVAEAEAMAAVLTSATEIAAQINEANADRIAEAKERKRREEEEREKARVERESALAGRKDMLMTELLGERVKIREAGIKGMRPAIVEVREVRGEYNYVTAEYASTGEFEIHFAWTHETDRYNRTQHLNRMRRLDVKVGAGWRTVWDDGDDDLSSYDRETPVSSAKPAPKYDGELGESL